MLSLVESDISGMISCGLCQHGAGDLHTLRGILREVIKEELQICYDMPPKECSAHRETVYELFLPWPKQKQQKQRSSACSVAMRRYVLGTMLNGDISDESAIHHYCPMNCCQDERHCLDKMMSWVVWALIPTKTPRYTRGKWLQQSPCLNWCGLLACHHGLLQKVMLRFTGCPQAAPQTQFKEDQEDNRAGWDFLEDLGDLGSGGGPAATSVPTAHEQAQEAGGNEQEDCENENEHEIGAAFADGEANNTNQESETLSSTDWQIRNKQYKKKAGLWSQSNPGPRLAVAASILNVSNRLLHAFLHISSDEWERREVLKEACGGHRSFRLLVAARNEDSKVCLRSLGSLLNQAIGGISHKCMTGYIRTLAFRLISRMGCALQAQLCNPRRGEPYQTFLKLGEEEISRESPHCMRDEFTAAFRDRYGPEMNSEAFAVLESVARQVDLDIAQLESKHAAIRRLVYTKNVQTWVPEFAIVAAERLCRDTARIEEEWRTHSHVEDDDAARHQNKAGSATSTPTTKQTKPLKKIGGGAWRVYIHLQHSGERFTLETVRKLRDGYRNLSDTDKKHFEDLGRLAHISWQHGYRPFPAPERRKQQQQQQLLDAPAPVGSVLEDGTIVMADSTNPQSLQKVSLMSLSLRDFDADVKQIRQSFRKAAQEEKKQLAEDKALLKRHSREALQAMPEFFPRVPPLSTFVGGASSSEAAVSATMTWLPPCSAMAQEWASDNFFHRVCIECKARA